MPPLKLVSPESLGQRLARFRKEHGLTQVQLADKVGIIQSLVADYERDSRPYDKRVFEPLTDTKLSFLHLHNIERPFIDQFKDFNVPVIHYSLKTSGIPISEMRTHFSQAIAGGVDEINYESLTTAEIKQQWIQAREQAGAKYIAVPGCSLPTASPPDTIALFPRPLGI